MRYESYYSLSPCDWRYYTLTGFNNGFKAGAQLWFSIHHIKRYVVIEQGGWGGIFVAFKGAGITWRPKSSVLMSPMNSLVNKSHIRLSKRCLKDTFLAAFGSVYGIASLFDYCFRLIIFLRLIGTKSGAGIHRSRLFLWCQWGLHFLALSNMSQQLWLPLNLSHTGTSRPKDAVQWQTGTCNRLNESLV